MTEPTKSVSMTEIVMPQHTNPIGVVFGGVIMSWIDIASAIAASRHSKTHVATASIDALQFMAPIRLGWIVNIKASVNRVWRSSMEVGVQVTAENPLEQASFQTATAYLTMVALNEQGKSVPVVDVIPETEEEKRRYHEAGIRRQNRAGVQSD